MRAPIRLALLTGVAWGCALPSAAEVLYLQAFVNGVDQDVIVRVDQRANDFYLQADDLRVLGLKPQALLRAERDLIAIRSIEGVVATYSALEQRLDLEVPNELLTPQLLGSTAEPHQEPSSAIGLVNDYSLHLQSDKRNLQQQTGRLLAPPVLESVSRAPVTRESEYARSTEKTRTASLFTSTRLFSPVGLFFNRGYTQHDAGEVDYVREDTFWVYSELDSLRTWRAGDFIGSSLTWTRSVRLGGAQLSRNFNVRPELVTFPLPELGGTALVPTTVDLYVNGARQFRGEARAGPFLFTDPPPLTGAGEVAIVYQDPFGRRVTSTRPLYVDTRLLEEGLSDYHVDVGYPRRNYGTASADYGADPEAVASLRYGVTKAFTLEAHTELAESLKNAGVGALLRLGRFGVLSGAVARSDGAHVGTLASLGYQYITPTWSIDLYDRRTRSDYGDLGTLEGVPVPPRLTRGSASVWFLRSQALSVNYVDQRLSTSDVSRVISLSYNGNWLNGRLNTYLSVFRDRENPDEDGAFLTINISFGGGASGYSTVSRNSDDRTTTLGASRPVDYDLGGFGWSLTAESGNDDYRRGNMEIDHRSRFADVALMLTRTGTAGEEQDTVSLDATGSLVIMRGGLFATRAIYDGFALVSTRGLPNVTVLRENRSLGRTNRRGYLLVPDLPSWRSSRIAIDLLQAPVDVSASNDQLLANPREFSGVIVEFPIERMRGATLVLVDERQQPLAPGLSVTLLGNGTTSVTGYDGLVFFPALEAKNRLSVETPDGTCEAEVPFDAAQAMRTLGPFVCRAKEP